MHDPEESVHPEEEKVRCISGGDFSRVSCCGQQFEVREVEPTDEVMDLAVDPEPELDVAKAERDERRSMNSHRSDTLGDNPRDRREQITAHWSEQLHASIDRGSCSCGWPMAQCVGGAVLSVLHHERSGTSPDNR